MWKEDKFSGWGRESRCNGDVFEGKFEDGLLCDYMKLKYLLLFIVGKLIMSENM